MTPILSKSLIGGFNQSPVFMSVMIAHPNPIQPIKDLLQENANRSEHLLLNWSSTFDVASIFSFRMNWRI